jgi:multidrug resistance efflux pump
MTRNRIVALLAVLGLAGGGLTVLMAAKDPAERESAKAQAAGPSGTALVCLGTVDTEEPMVKIYPDNFPQPSRILKVLAKEGEAVTKGQSLLELDRQMYLFKVGEAEAGVKSAEAELARAQAAIRAHRSQVTIHEKELEAKQAELNARKEELAQAERALTGGNKNLVELELPKANVKAAEVNLEVVRMKLADLKAEVPTYLEELANAGVAQKRELKRQAELARDLTTCTAPADGRIVRSFVSEGSQFGPTSQQPAFWFVKEGPRIVRAEVTQEFAGRIIQGQAAEIEDESDATQKWTGRVTKVVDQFLPKRHASGSGLDLFPVNNDPVLECLVSIDAGSGSAPPRFGQRVRVTIPKANHSR